MHASVNRVVLLGTIGRYGVEVRYATTGVPCASFMLVLIELGQDGQEHKTIVPCEVWGKKAEATGDIEPGTLVLFEGRLRTRKNGENQWGMYIVGFEVVPVLAPTATMTGSST